MNDEFEIDEVDEFPETSSEDESSVEPEYATKDDLRAFAQELLGSMQSQTTESDFDDENDDPLSGYDPEFVADMNSVLARQAQAIHAEYAPIMSVSMANQAAQMVAGEMGHEVQQYISGMVAKMDPLAAKAMLNDPDGIEMLHNMAIGHQAKRGGGSRVPRTYEPGGIEFDSSFSASDRASMDSFMKAFGVDRKRATELYREAQRQGK